MALELLRVDPYNGDATTGITYYGYAMAGTQESDAKWSIKRKSVVGGVLKYEYPYISGEYIPETYPATTGDGIAYMQLSGMIWNLRTTYTYK